jgi:type I restriction enzyme S subunit
VDALEQTILQLAVRGLLVPQDPQDEPASELLKKIRAEKDKIIAEGKIKRDKPLPPIAEDEQPFALPTGWVWVRVGNLGVTQTGGTPASSKPEYFDGNFPFIGPGQITPAGKILPPEKFISERGRLESAVAEPGDILMVCIGGSIGKCAAASYATAFNQQINSIHPVLVSSEYVLNAMGASEFMASVGSTATGSATPIISKGKWDLLLLPVPPLAEQSRIVTRVAQLRRLCADLRQRLSASQSTQTHLAEALVQDVV